MTRTDEFIPYARAIEEAFIQEHRGVFILRPNEIQLIYEWFNLGIPAEIVTEGIHEMAERYAARHNGRPLSSLKYCRWHIEEAHLKMHPAITSPKKGKSPSGKELLRRIVAAWKEFSEGLDREDPIRRPVIDFVEEMEDRIESRQKAESIVRDIRILRDALFTALNDSLPEEEQERLRLDLKSALKEKGSSLPPGMEETLIACQWRDLITRRFHLPALPL